MTDELRPEAGDESRLDELVSQAFERQPVAAAPSGFVEAVMRARSGDHRVPIPGSPPPARRRWPLRTALGTVAAVAVMALVWTLTARSRPGAGQYAPAARQEIALEGRGVAVLEAGSEVGWTRSGGETVWRQTSGNVFYRVERGGSFRLATPAGEVIVLGTCFRVEVDPMKLERQTKAGFVVGAALSAAVTVAVYEGRVRLVNGSGAVELAAGERGRLTARTPPRVVAVESAAGGSGSGSTAVPRLVPTAADAEELRTLRERATEQEKEITRLKQERGNIRETASPAFVDASKEQLLARVARCEVRYDVPEVMDAVPRTISDNRKRDLGLTDTERDAMNEAYAETHAQVSAQLRRLYVEIGGDAQIADKMSSGSLIGEVLQRLPEGEQREARGRLARERAGLLPPPGDPGKGSASERIFRLMMNLGDDLERKIGERIGAERAHGLRLRKDGWPGGRSSHSGC
jgi:hypothetical protein